MSVRVRHLKELINDALSGMLLLRSIQEMSLAKSLEWVSSLFFSRQTQNFLIICIELNFHMVESTTPSNLLRQKVGKTNTKGGVHATLLCLFIFYVGDNACKKAWLKKISKMHKFATLIRLINLICVSLDH